MLLAVRSGLPDWLAIHLPGESGPLLALSIFVRLGSVDGRAIGSGFHLRPDEDHSDLTWAAIAHDFFAVEVLKEHQPDNLMDLSESGEFHAPLVICPNGDDQTHRASPLGLLIAFSMIGPISLTLYGGLRKKFFPYSGQSTLSVSVSRVMTLSHCLFQEPRPHHSQNRCP